MGSFGIVHRSFFPCSYPPHLLHSSFVTTTSSMTFRVCEGRACLPPLTNPYGCSVYHFLFGMHLMGSLNWIAREDDLGMQPVVSPAGAPSMSFCAKYLVACLANALSLKWVMLEGAFGDLCSSECPLLQRHESSPLRHYALPLWRCQKRRHRVMVAERCCCRPWFDRSGLGRCGLGRYPSSSILCYSCRLSTAVPFLDILCAFVVR